MLLKEDKEAESGEFILREQPERELSVVFVPEFKLFGPVPLN